MLGTRYTLRIFVTLEGQSPQPSMYDEELTKATQRNNRALPAADIAVTTFVINLTTRRPLETETMAKDLPRKMLTAIRK